MILSFDLIATERLPSSYFKCIVKQTFLDKIQPQVFKLLILKFVLMNIYISNLSYDVNDSDLRELFEEYGEVSSAKAVSYTHLLNIILPRNPSGFPAFWKNLLINPFFSMVIILIFDGFQ